MGFDAPPVVNTVADPRLFLAGFTTLGRSAFARSGRFTVAISASALTAPLVDALAVAPLADAARSPLEVLRAYAGRLTVIPSFPAADLAIAPAGR